MLIKEVMTRDIQEIDPQTNLKDAAQKMKSLNVGALPVCQNDRLLGMLTDRDIAVRAVASGCDPSQTAASDAMTPGPVWCYEDEDVREAARIMEEKQIRRVLVFDRNNRVAGIVSLGDIATRLGNENLSGEVLERVSEPSQPYA